ncbi:hypothetical protein GK0931 [Geobacillus kaustophilus HTA426]|uniref:Uncharacterized protein n=1 Tax=Geobacillus kaustophilus (strain HTA426) TaxID=235909 RepID=Q5L1G4_GEOKA|nr:hypothetical protein GK0931 [Geobacillus kaustophilus HTA426]
MQVNTGPQKSPTPPRRAHAFHRQKIRCFSHLMKKGKRGVAEKFDEMEKGAVSPLGQPPFHYVAAHPAFSSVRAISFSSLCLRP